MDFDFSILHLPVARMRIDKYLSDVLHICSRNQLQQRLLSLEVNGSPVKQSRKIVQGDRVSFSLAAAAVYTLAPEEIPLDIVYEDDNVLVLNKPQGLVVHPGAGNYSGTLANGLLHHVSEMELYNDRPGIVHRLDKETSGIIITAKNEYAHEYLAKQFRERWTQKRYLAVVYGRPEHKRGIVTTCIRRDKRDRKKMAVTASEGKYAETEYRVLSFYGDYSFVVLKPKTGRTHQLRVHMKHLGCPIAGDPVYGSKGDATGSLMLHAYSLRIKLPGSDQVKTFRAPLPERFKRVLSALGRGTATPQEDRG